MTLGRESVVWLAVAMALVPVQHCLAQEQRPQQPERQVHKRVPILGPATAGGPPGAIDPPRLVEILRAIEDEPAYQRTAQWASGMGDGKLEVTKEKIADYIDPPRFYPLIGPAQIHHAHYKVSLSVPGDEQTRIVFVDHNHFHSIPFKSITIRSGAPPQERLALDEHVANRLTSWGHSIDLFGNVDVKQREMEIAIVAKPAQIRLQLSHAISFLGLAEELHVQLTPGAIVSGTLAGKVKLHHAGELLQCDSLAFSGDGTIIAEGGVRLRGTSKKIAGQMRLGHKPLGVTKETVLERLPSGKSPIVDFIADVIELDLRQNTITVGNNDRPTVDE